MTSAHEPIHPGEILLEEFLTPMGVTQYRLAQSISVPARRINEIVHGKRAISPDTALRLSRALGTSERFWMNLQIRYDLDLALAKNGESLARITPLHSPIARPALPRPGVEVTPAARRGGVRAISRHRAPSGTPSTEESLHTLREERL